MVTETAEKVDSKEAIGSQGFGVTGHIGGLPRTTYYTPDGRIIKAIASMREFRKLVGVDGAGKNVYEGGVRDANLDRGWLTAMPEVPKPYCEGCDKWHDTDEEVAACIAIKEAKAKKWEAKAKRMRKGEGEVQEAEIKELKSQVEELKDMVAQLLAKSEAK